MYETNSWEPSEQGCWMRCKETNSNICVTADGTLHVNVWGIVVHIPKEVLSSLFSSTAEKQEL